MIMATWSAKKPPKKKKVLKRFKPRSHHENNNKFNYKCWTHFGQVSELIYLATTNQKVWLQNEGACWYICSMEVQFFSGLLILLKIIIWCLAQANGNRETCSFYTGTPVTAQKTGASLTRASFLFLSLRKIIFFSSAFFYWFYLKS